MADGYSMKLLELEGKERLVFLFSLFLVVIVFAFSLYTYVNPPVKVLEAEVFDTYQTNGKTVIWTQGEGKLTLHGQYDIEIGATYRITYQSRSRDNAEIVLSVEKIG